MQAERDILQVEVLPYITKKARHYGQQVVFTDLRWGLNTSQLETREGARKVLRTCLREIDRCHPYIIVLLGDRYGWMPDEELMRSTIEDEVSFRASQGENYASLMDKLEKSVTELEIEYGALMKEGRCFFYFRDPLPEKHMTPAQKISYLSLEAEDHQRMQALKDRIRREVPAEKVHSYVADFDPTNGVVGLNEFANRVKKDLIEHFEHEWRTLIPEGGIASSALAYQNECKAMAETFAGRAGAIKELLDFSNNEQDWLLVISGGEGTGKSAIMAKIARVLDSRENTIVIPFICGFDSKSMLARDVLMHFISQMQIHLNQDNPEWDEAAYTTLISDCPPRELCAVASSTAYHINQSLCQKVVLCIDGIDLLDDDGTGCIPTPYDSDFKIIISSSASNLKTLALQEREHCKTISLDALSESDKRDVTQSILKLHHKELLPEPVLKSLFEKEQSNNALFLSLLVQRLIMFDQIDFQLIQQDRDTVAARGVQEDGQLAIIRYMQAVLDVLPNTLPELCAQLYNMAGARISPVLCHMIGELLSLNANGWRESDLRGMVTNLGEEWNPVSFSLMRLYLTPFLIERGHARIAFSHASVFEGVLGQARNIEPYQVAALAWLKTLPKDDVVRAQELPRFISLCHDDEGLLALMDDLLDGNGTIAMRTRTILTLFKDDAQILWLSQQAETWSGKSGSLFVRNIVAPLLMQRMQKQELSILSAILSGILLFVQDKSERLELHMILAQTSLLLGLVDKALSLYKAMLIEDDTQPPIFWLSFGHALSQAGENSLALERYGTAKQLWEQAEQGASSTKQGLINAAIALAKCGSVDALVLIEEAIKMADMLNKEDKNLESMVLSCRARVVCAQYHKQKGDMKQAKTRLLWPALQMETLMRLSDSPKIELLNAQILLCLGDLELAADDDFPAMVFYTQALTLLEILSKKTGAPPTREMLASCWERLLPAETYEEYDKARCLAMAQKIRQELCNETGDMRYLTKKL